jgi:ABC-type Fe3+ transport system substrate-binding protein
MKRAPRSIWLAVMIAMLGLKLTFNRSVGAAEQATSQRRVQQLIEGAQKEGQVNLFLVTSLSDRGAKELNQAFNKRFGLNVKFNSTLGDASRQFSQTVQELKIGLPPTFDGMYVSETFVFQLLAEGGIERVEGWEELLKEISPEAYSVREKVSPLDLSGYAFAWGTRAKVMNYNSDLIADKELPKTRVEMGDPKYAGMYFMPPFITDAEYGILAYPKENWLEVVRSWGRSKPTILAYDAGLQRMLLGEFKFAQSNDYYMFKYKSRDPKTPMGLAFFNDLTPLTYAWHVVRKGAKNPNAAKLFALWATTSEANRIFENLDYSATGNLLLNTGSMSRQISQALDKQKIKPVSWWDSKKNQDLLRWYTTDEGRAYSRELSAAQTGRK